MSLFLRSKVKVRNTRRYGGSIAYITDNYSSKFRSNVWKWNRQSAISCWIVSHRRDQLLEAPAFPSSNRPKRREKVLDLAASDKIIIDKGQLFGLFDIVQKNAVGSTLQQVLLCVFFQQL